ncbi:MAG: ABC transporter permease [Gemmatimonadetes bacterium]|jgi:sodium transport system permease protein|nr:ABC transporter permease [Gemmatimonadota bacterium]MDE0963657.1 ABC transporter permease [Candidatus Latescibacterota bacterium]MBT5327020.1 ABC transporter permease [Gemmatimonadota bacterium]MBT5801078.1 ABC transporter permease [Gemmatimonadota bacterium]MBT6619992.1 ABC transporter permease [Gemmatimonadota bacterium]
MNQVLAVLRKELIDGLRDRRSVVSALLFPLLAPMMVTFMLNIQAERKRESMDMEIPIVSAERAPDLVNWIERSGFTVVDGPEDPEEAVREGDLDFVFVVPEDFAEDFAEGKTAEIELVHDGTKKDASASIGRARGLIQSYSRNLGTLRLIARGVSPQIALPVKIEDVDAASARQKAAHFMSFILVYVIMAAFMAGMNLAIDSTAGERERSSFEPLLVNPVTRLALALGKWLAAVVFSATGIALTLGSLVFALQQASLQELGINLTFSVPVIAGVLFTALPLAFFASGMQMLVSSFARSFKEAQTYVSLLIVIPIIPTVFVILYSLNNEWWMAPIPVLSQQVLLTEILGGETGSIFPYIVSGLSSFALGLLSIWVTARLFAREKIIFGR